MTSLPFPLSLQRVTRAEPRVFDNTERLQFHRQNAPVTFANTDFPRTTHQQQGVTREPERTNHQS